MGAAGKKGGFYDNLWRHVSQAVGAPVSEPGDMRHIHKQAVDAGVLMPGTTARYALPEGTTFESVMERKIASPAMIEKTIRDQFRDPKQDSGLVGLMRGRLPEGATEDEIVAAALKANEQAMQDPRTYVSVTTPREALAGTVYGPAFGEILRASLLSADRPKLLEGPVLQGLSRDRINRNLDRPAVIFRTPGLGYEHKTPDGEDRRALGFASGRGTYVVWPRHWEKSGVPPHELRHLTYHSGAGYLDHPLFTESPGLQTKRQQYMSGWGEAQAELGTLKGMYYQLTGKAPSNKADAEEFMHSLLAPPPKISDPNPEAKFGPRAGSPIPDFNMNMNFWHNMMEKASPKDRDKARELIPKVLDTTKPRTVV